MGTVDQKTSVNTDVSHNLEVELPTRKKVASPIFMPPGEFRMRLLKRMVSAENNIDKRGLTKIQRSDSERALKATIVYPNGEVGTLISLEKINTSKDKDDNHSEGESGTLPNIRMDKNGNNYGFSSPTPRKHEKPLRLPPIILPPIYTVQPRPLMSRDFETPASPPRQITDEEWDDLHECRYLRPAMKKFRGRVREVYG